MDKKDYQFSPDSKEVKSAVKLITKKQKFSIAMLQTYLGKGHDYVSALGDWLEKAGVVGSDNGDGSRDVLITSIDELSAGGNVDKPRYTDKTKVTTKKSSDTWTRPKIWFVVIFSLIILWIIGNAMKSDSPQKNQPVETHEEKTETTVNYVGQDAKVVYTTLITQGYTVKFLFDRANNGGFSDEQFQDFVINDSFASSSYSEMPFVVTGQTINDKNATLTIDYGSVVEQNNAQADREAKLESKLSIITAMSSCEIYGERNYRNFKMHSIVGKIAEYAIDDDTWFLKYTADANGYKNLNMECYVTGTDSSPVVKDFKLY